METLLTMYQYRVIGRLAHYRQKALEDVNRRRRPVREWHMHELHAGALAESLFLPKPAAAERVSGAASGADNRLESVLSLNCFQIADARLPAAHEDSGHNYSKMGEPVVARPE